MEEFLHYLISPILEQPEKLTITRQGVSLVIKVDESEVGKIIGKKGGVINAIRTLSRTYCAAHQIPLVNIILDSPQLPPKKD